MPKTSLPHLSMMKLISFKERKILLTGNRRTIRRNCAEMESQLILKLRKLTRGQRIAVFPFGQRYGDIFSAYGEICDTASEMMPVEFQDPFRAIFEDFDDEYLYIIYDRFGCLRMPVRFIHSVEALNPGSPEE